MCKFYINIICYFILVMMLFASDITGQNTTAEPPEEYAVGTWQMVWGSQKHMGIQLIKGELNDIPLLKWQFDYPDLGVGGGEGHPVIGDINNDGFNEVVGVIHGPIFALDGETGDELWNYVPAGWTITGGRGTVALADVNNDGIIEVIDFLMGVVKAIRGTDGSLVWEYDLGSGTVATSPAVGDINGDGVLEVVVAGSDEIVAVSGTNGAFLWSFTFPSGWGGMQMCSPALGDIDCDGVKEVFCMNGDMMDQTLFCIRGDDGSQVWSYSFGMGGSWSSPVLGDLNHDCSEDVVVNGGDNQLYALNGPDGSVLWSSNNSAYAPTPVIADINYDGNLEIVQSAGTNIFAVNSLDGSQIWTSPVAPTDGNTGWFGSTPILGDFSSANPGLECVVATAYAPADNRVFMFSVDGTQLWNLSIAEHTYEGVSVGDIDNDGCAEIVAVPS